MKLRASFLVLVLFATMLLPSVLASHTMGHRYLVHGRLLDPQGMPLQNTTVSLKIMSRGTSLAEIITRTDCLGDFESWEGQPGRDPGPNGGLGVEPGVEQNSNPDYGQYIAFHFHDTDLSDRYKVQLSVGQEKHEYDFVSKVRQTFIRQQMSISSEAPCTNSDEFNQTFVVGVSAISDEEWRWRTDMPPFPRDARIRVGASEQGGTTDFNGAFVAKLTNVTMDGSVSVDLMHVGHRSVPIDDEAEKFRRVHAAYRIGDDSVGVLNDFKYVGVGLIVIAIVVGLFIGANKMRDKMAERKLRETSTRRRFRRDKQP